jgi:type IV pilus assembly protein PilB
MTGYEVRPAVASSSDIESVLERINDPNWGSGGGAAPELEPLDEELPDLSAPNGNGRGPLYDLTPQTVNFGASGEDASVIQLVQRVISEAVERGSSDIHFEPQEEEMRVRYRIDGVLQEAAIVPSSVIPAVTSRIKILSDLDIAERRIPQDGRVTTQVDGKMIDLRVATLPAQYGENVVMRILDSSKAMISMEQLGMLPQAMERFTKAFSQSHGAVLVTGPTGSGKSTSLYAALNQLNTIDKNIITIEDPVEYQLEGLTQVQVNKKAGLTFAAGLRSMMRADPDIIMVGEIRDRETAQIAIESALTGHLVLSTLHTNDAPGALTRLNEMGVEPFLTGSAVSSVLAQRLARKLCTHCCEMYSPTTDEMIKARVSPEVAAAADGVVFYRKKGCPRCGQTGYKGRIGVYQMLVMSETLEGLAASKASREELERAAIEEGMRTLWDDGLAKVASGLTSLEELARVTV